MSNIVHFRQQGPLQYCSEVELPVLYGKFSPSTIFCIGNVIGGIPIGNMDDEFMRLFLPIPFPDPTRWSPTKKISPIPKLRVSYWDLLRDTRDIDIFSVWLGEEKRVVDLVRVFQIMSLGQKGPALCNNMMNVAFVTPVFDDRPHTLYWNTYLGTWHINLVPGPVEELQKLKYRRKLPQGARIFGGLSPDEKHEPLAF
ncbi:hypothetical protein FJY93_00350 [Candidatus Kaiserbacteria bacterium]|nr:hypothetical protein [Candidatus Kaiserbacteria bacterium]